MDSSIVNKVIEKTHLLPCLRKWLLSINRDNPEVLQKLADSKFNFRSTAGCIKQRKPHISREPKELTTSLEIDDGIFIETNLSAQSIMRFLKSLLQQYQINQTEFSIDVIADDESSEEEQNTDEWCQARLILQAPSRLFYLEFLLCFWNLGREPGEFHSTVP